MSCSSIDVKGYLLGELSEEERNTIETHFPACTACREELERLQLTQASMMTLRDEEIPQRIAFVSDKVFEPNWWQRFWGSVPRLGFASAAMLSLAIFVHAFTRPETVVQSPSLDSAAVQEIVEREVAKRLDTAIAEAVAASELRNEEKTAELLQAAAQTYERQRQADLETVRESFVYIRKQANVSVMQLAWANREGTQ